MWVTQFGNPELSPALGPAANDKFVAVINGSTLYLLDRASGRILSERRSAACPAPVRRWARTMFSCRRSTGLIEGYPLDPDAPSRPTWFYQSFGHTMVPPLVTPESVAWTTDAGLPVRRRRDQAGVHFRLETIGEFDARPAYRAPLIYAISLVGELFAVDEHERHAALEIRDRFSDESRSGRRGRSAVRHVRRADAPLRRRHHRLPTSGRRPAFRSSPPPPSRTSTASIATARSTF